MINQLFQTLVFIQIFGKSLSTISLSKTDPKQYKQNGHIPEVYLELCEISQMVLFSKVDSG